MNLRPVEIKAFVPAYDFALSKAFYEALGFEVPWSSEDLAYLRLGSTSFLLQANTSPEFAQNFVMHMLVENVDDWYRLVMSSNIPERFKVSVQVPQDQPWHIRDFPLLDPSGVLWRIGQNIPVQAQ
ncbi:VOC family protein [Dyella sp.]|uniref:VOC family protein n=1 Tax=Dyella sp. TaxID=1869338 RepID=UPI002ECFD7DC